MEPFHDPCLPDDPGCAERQFAVYRADPEWKRIYRFLRRGYWHVTTPRAWNDIEKSGAIKPNLDGRYPMKFSHDTEQSYGYVNKCVSLFDFVSPSEEEIIRQWGDAWSVLVDDKVTNVLIWLDRQRLKRRIIPASAAQEAEKVGRYYRYIPFCEVWYPDEISKRTFIAVYRLPPCSVFGEFCPVPTQWD